MKFINCNNCNKNKKKILKRIKYNSKSLKLVKCKNCSLVFFSPRLSNEFYEKIYQEDLLNNSNYYTITSLEDKNDFKNRLNLALTYRPNINSVLDIGCSTGAFLEACKEKNIKNIYGVELNKESRKKSQKKKI